MSAPRYAIYYAPARDSTLWRFGSAVLGYDAATGADIPHLVPPNCDSADWHALTCEPRRYGFHATLKAPFELAEGRSEGELRAFLRNVAGSLPPVPPIRLVVRPLGTFVALVPAEESAALGDFAFRCVEAFEPLRAPLTAEDRARRLKSPLTPPQQAYLAAYGYPYVGDEFRFHMTLTGSLPADRVAAIAHALADAYAREVPAETVAIDRIALYRQTSRTERFRLLDSAAAG